MRMHRIYHKKVMLRDCSRLSWERERLDHALRGAAGHGRPCPYGSPARSGGWRGTADRARTGRPRALGGGGARQTVPGGVARAPRGAAGHGMPCPYGSPALPGGWWGTACRARTGRPRAPGRGGARQTVPGGVACALRGVAGHGRPCAEGSPARSGGWRGMVCRARRGRPRAPGGGGARQTVRGGVACALRGVAGHGRPCAEGSPARSGAWWGTADRARTGRPRAPGGGGARQTVRGGVACALRGVAGHGRPCPEGSPALPGAWWGTACRARRGRLRAPGGVLFQRSTLHNLCYTISRQTTLPPGFLLIDC